jgi:protein-tyrosine phosphatase
MALFSVCFVCTGNICRSPIAEAVFRSHAADAGLDGRISVGSAGTSGWHEGEPADPRTMRTLESAGYELAHAARQFQPEWFDELDLVIALDEGHRRELRALARTPQDAAKIHLLRAYDPDASAHVDLDVPDPYYGGEDGFADVLRLVEAAVPGLLDEVARALGGSGAPGGSADRGGSGDRGGSAIHGGSADRGGSAALGERTA